MALNPELLKRRKRIRMPRAPPRTLGAGPEEADEKLEKLLEEILAEAKRETLFTMTLEKHRLLSALSYARFLTGGLYNCELQIAAGATATLYLPIPAGWAFTPLKSTFYSSLPWWLTVMIWVDSDAPALPQVALTRAPGFYEHPFLGLMAVGYFMRFTVTNNHATDTANFLSIQEWSFMRRSVWDMLTAIYLKPIVEYAQEKAEELTGRPFP